MHYWFIIITDKQTIDSRNIGIIGYSNTTCWMAACNYILSNPNIGYILDLKIYSASESTN